MKLQGKFIIFLSIFAISLAEEDFVDLDDVEVEINANEVENVTDLIYDSDPPIIYNMSDLNPAMARNTLIADTKIDLGVQSQLISNPGAVIQIYFEVTNLREETVFYNFQVVDERRFLQQMMPRQAWLLSGQTTTVTVTASVPQNTEVGVKDKITLTAQGLSRVSQSATLTVSTQSTYQDNVRPNLYWTYGNRCEGRTAAGVCASHIWSLDLSAQDYDTGILRITSSPKGLLLRNAFVAGTSSVVTATYSSTCCQTRVTISVYDVAGNQRTQTFDVTDLLFTEATIAAVTLGIILLIIIIAALILLCVWCCKRRKNSQELPIYRSHSTRTRERET